MNKSVANRQWLVTLPITALITLALFYYDGVDTATGFVTGIILCPFLLVLGYWGSDQI